MKVTTKLWVHQQQMHDFVLKRFNDKPQSVGHGWDKVNIPPKFVFMVAGCATGKTLTMLKVIETMGFNRILVITTKAAATSAWLKEVKKHTEGLTVVAPVDVSVRDKKAILKQHKDIKPFMFVVNYESSWRMEKELAAFGFDLIIADEGHKLQSHNSKQSIIAARFSENIPYKVDMTGTGWEDRPTMIYGQVRWFNSERKGRSSKILGSWTDFFNKYVDYTKYQNIPIIKGYKRQTELQTIIDPFTLIVDSEEVLELPEALHIEHVLQMPPVMRRAYDSLEEHKVYTDDDIQLIVDNPLEMLLRLHQVTSGYLPDDNGDVTPLVSAADNPKLSRTLDLLDEIGGKPAVIFTRFKHDVGLLYSTLSNKGYEVLRLTGELQQHNEFQAGQGQVLVANIQAGAAGIELTRSRYCIYYSLGFSRTDYLQSTYRLRREGADMNHPITFYHLIMENSVDEYIRIMMGNKEQWAEFITNTLTNIIK